MRIRSTKPEFWRSKTIAALPWDVRLVLKGLESYVDDNGVGKDDIALIAADVFPRDLSTSPRDTLARLADAISTLHDSDLIARYEIEGEELIYVDRWKELQRIDRPTKGRFRRPDGTLEYSEDVDRESYRKPRDNYTSPPVNVLPGTGEQGNRGEGTGEQGIPPTAAVAVATRDDAQQLIGEWIEHCEERPPERVIGQVAKEAKAMLGEGISADRVRAGLADWHRKGLHPSSLPSVVHEVTVRATGQSVSRRQAETNDMFDRAARRAIARDQQ